MGLASLNRRKHVVDQLARMLVRHLGDHSFKGLTPAEIATRLGIIATVTNMPWWTDIPQICEAASLDIGLTIRDAKGNEVTLWPAENFASAPKLRKSAWKELPAATTIPALPGSRVIGFQQPGSGRPGDNMDGKESQ